MENIKIIKMEYEQEQYFTANYCFKEVNTAICVNFTLGIITGEIIIPIEKVSTMDEEKVKHYLYNYLNSKLERKFIDEI